MTRTREHIYDELLVLRSQEGDDRAFGELIERHQQRLFAHALQLTGRRDAAGDAVQETWIAVVRGLARLDDPARFAGFAHRILVRRCADWTRRQQRDRRLETAFAREAAVAGEAPAEDAGGLRQVLDRLPSDRRTILSLHYLQGITVSDIASLMRVPAGTVKSRLHHARKQLKRALEREKR